MEHPLPGDSNRRMRRELLRDSLLQRACVVVFLLSASGVSAAQSKGLPAGPMQAKVKAACTQCHSASKITSQHKTRKEWDAQLDKMIGLGAEVPDSERAAFLNYLTKNFGPEGSKAAPKKNTAE